MFKEDEGSATGHLREATVARPEREKMAGHMKKRDAATHSVRSHLPGPCGDPGRAAALPVHRYFVTETPVKLILDLI